MPTFDEVLDYLSIDYPDEVITANVTRAMKTAEATLKGSIGADVFELLPADPRLTEMALIYIDDLYSNRGVGAKVSSATRQLVHTMEWQLRLDLRARRKEVQGL